MPEQNTSHTHIVDLSSILVCRIIFCKPFVLEISTNLCYKNERSDVPFFLIQPSLFAVRLRYIPVIWMCDDR